MNQLFFVLTLNEKQIVLTGELKKNPNIKPVTGKADKSCLVFTKASRITSQPLEIA